MSAAYPKPDGERRNRNPKAFEWLELPAEGRSGEPPSLPALRSWSAETVRWWAALWAKPQAIAWDQSGETVARLAVLYDDLQQVEPGKASGISAEMRAIEDRHGLSPKAMLQLRWRIVELEAPAAQPTTKPKTDRRKRVLEVVSNASG